jgi:hypothetical protein
MKGVMGGREKQRRSMGIPRPASADFVAPGKNNSKSGYGWVGVKVK